MTSEIVLLVDTPCHRYVIDRADVLAIELVGDQHMPTLPGPPRIYVELGALLDPADTPRVTRRRALLVPLRRRIIALLVDQVETVEAAGLYVPLPTLLAARLQQPWAIGALLFADEVIIQLDLRAVARSALLQTQAVMQSHIV